MNKHNQDGSVHTILVSVALVIILGGVGFLFWNNFLQPKPDTKIESSQKAGSDTNSVVKPRTLSLSDWKVKFTITDELKKSGIEVKKATSPTINTDGSEGVYTYYIVSTARQRVLESHPIAKEGNLTEEDMDKICEAGSAVSVSRGTESGTSSEVVPPQINAKPIRGFYYVWGIPSAGGCDGPDTKAIVNALKSLEAM